MRLKKAKTAILPALALCLALALHCIYADTNPPNPEELKRKPPSLHIRVEAEPLAPLLIRYWDENQPYQVPLSNNHRVDRFGRYLNILPVSERSAHYSLWLFLDVNHNDTIDSEDKAFVQIAGEISDPSGRTNLDLLKTQALPLAPVAPRGDLPSPEGAYYCFFKPAEVRVDSIHLNEGTRFEDGEPFASWKKRSPPSPPSAQKLKRAFLPVHPSINRFAGICVFDHNQDHKFNQGEPTFAVGEFQVSSSATHFFTILPR